MSGAPEPDKLLPPGKVAELLHVSERTLRRYRKEQCGPSWRRTGPRLVRYTLADVCDWLARQSQDGHPA